MLDQPPSGGCVLKLLQHHLFRRTSRPAAFGRLCVETIGDVPDEEFEEPAAFGRLCVETSIYA